MCVFLTEAVGNIISFLGMQPCERSDKVPENKNSHVLFLAGRCWKLRWMWLQFSLWQGFFFFFTNQMQIFNVRLPRVFRVLSASSCDLIGFPSIPSQVCFGEVMTCWFELAWRWLTASLCRWQFAAAKRQLLMSSWHPWAKHSCCSFVPTQPRDVSPFWHFTWLFSTALKLYVYWYCDYYAVNNQPERNINVLLF